MKKVIFIAAALCVLAACNKEVISAPEAEVGYLNFDLTADNGIKVETKAVTAQQLNAFFVKYSDQTTTYAELSSAIIPMNVGTYTVEAYNYTEGDAEIGNGRLRLYDSKSVTVLANQVATARLECVPYSSEVKLEYTETFSEKYPNAVFTLTKGTRTCTLDTTNPVYFNNTPNNIIKVNYELKANGTSSTAKEIFGGELELNNAHSLKVKIDIVTTTGELQFSVTASDVLTGQTNTITINPYTGQSSASGNVNDPQN